MKSLNKITNILLVAVLAISMIGFTSCNDEVNDNMGDLKTSFEKEISDLQDQVDDLNQQLSTIKSCTCTPHPDVAAMIHDSLMNYYTKAEMDAALQNMQAAIDAANAAIQANTDSIVAIKGRLESEIQQNAAAISTLANRVTTNENDIATLKTAVQNIQNDITNMKSDISTLQTQMAAVIDSAAVANAQARANAAEIELLKQRDDLQSDSIKALYDSISVIRNLTETYLDSALNYSYELYQSVQDSLLSINNKIDATNLRVDQLETLLNDKVAELQGEIDSLANEVSDVKTRLDKVEDDVDKLTGRVDDLTDRMNKAIYSMELNGTINPVFGYFSMPFDVTSNMLLAYYGTTSLPIEFPTQSDPYGSVVANAYKLTAADVAAIGGLNSIHIAGGTTLVSEGANAGKIYFFINPSDVDLSTTDFTLVNTLDEESSIKLDTVVPCDEVLYAGYSYRAPAKGTSAHAFYEAPAVLGLGLTGSDLADAAEAAKFDINASALKQTAKDFYNQYIKKTGSDASFTTLAANCYDLINRPAQRYALKATWTDSLGTRSCKTSAQITANSIKPLSFAAFEDVSLKKLPTITPISELSDFTFDVKKIHFNVDVNLDYAQSNIHLNNLSVDFSGVNVTVEVPEVVGGSLTGNTTTVTVNLDDLQTYFNDHYNTTITGWSANINTEINKQVDALIDQINDQLDDMTDDIEGQLNTQIQDVVNDALGKVNGKLSTVNDYISKGNSLIKKANKAINKINSLLDNVNVFFQVTMLYEANGDYHFLSNSQSVPSVFNCSGTTGAIELFPTTFNAEIVAPAYKKFVAVTNVWKNGSDVSAQDGNADCKSKLASANNQGNFKQVIDGGHMSVAFVGTKGYTYEILYSALDYSGKISQRKYYVTVK